MNQTEFEKLCRQIADVPWDYSEWSSGKISAYLDGRFIRLAPNGHVSFTDGSATLTIKRAPWGAMPDRHIATARSFFGNLELEYIAREIAPRANWEFAHNWAHIPGLSVERFPTYFSIEIRDERGFVDSMAEDTSAGLIAAYREHRAQHDAARGVKTRQPKPQPRFRPLWQPPDLKDLTIAHARNIVACLANPDKYTHIAQWARVSPTTRQRVLDRALEDIND